MFERLTQFTHDASHELRTPLAVINSELDLALRTGDHEQHIAAAKEEVKAGAALIEDLLGLAELDSATLDGHPVDLSALVEREVERCSLLAQAEGVRLESRVEPGVVARADEGLVTQLVANLVGNAIKFTPRDGVITVTLSRSAFRVKDTGPGIAPEHLPHVFERFYQADGSRSQDGHGLGLAIARNIAEVHGWRIERAEPAGRGRDLRRHLLRPSVVLLPPLRTGPACSLQSRRGASWTRRRCARSAKTSPSSPASCCWGWWVSRRSRAWAWTTWPRRFCRWTICTRSSATTMAAVAGLHALLHLGAMRSYARRRLGQLTGDAPRA